MAVVNIAVTHPGNRVDAILACLTGKVGKLDFVGLGEYEITVMGQDIKIAEAVERIQQALQDCDPDWRDFIAVAAPPGPS